MAFSWDAGLASFGKSMANSYDTILKEQRAEAAERRRIEAVTDRDEHMLRLRAAAEREASNNKAKDALAFKQSPEYRAQQQYEQKQALALEKAKLGLTENSEEKRFKKIIDRKKAEKDKAWALQEKDLKTQGATDSFIEAAKRKFYGYQDATPTVPGLSLKDATKIALDEYNSLKDTEEFKKFKKDHNITDRQYIQMRTIDLQHSDTKDFTKEGEVKRKESANLLREQRANNVVAEMNPKEKANFVARVDRGDKAANILFNDLPEAIRIELKAKYSKSKVADTTPINKITGQPLRIDPATGKPYPTIGESISNKAGVLGRGVKDFFAGDKEDNSHPVRNDLHF